jgi:uncharacterized protein YgbK (DUF1537 family)
MQSTGRECLLIADDLTGACDAAVPFAIRGYRTVAAVSLCPQAIDAPVVSLTTDTRDLDCAAAAPLVAQAARWAEPRPRMLFKKIDSTLRGNPGFEIRAAMEAFGCDAAVVTPALPAMGRVVAGGVLRLERDPDFGTIEIARLLESQGLDIRHVLVADAASDADLDRVVAAGLTRADRVLWAGSAGLAAALARALPARPQGLRVPPRAGAVIFCIGSPHKVTLAQEAALRASSALVRGHVLLKIPQECASAGKLREVLTTGSGAALFLCGGDTASFVCRAIGARRIELIDEIVPGLPRGILREGPLNGIAVATKSGGFGSPDALIQVADFFSCPHN